MSRTPLIDDAQPQMNEQLFATRQHSYELTQKLTYFVISAELIFCGYMLLNVDKLNGVKGVSYLFATCGVAALFGIFWRFCYNQTYHDRAHGVKKQLLYMLTARIQTVVYWLYVGLSVLTFVWGVVAGFNYLHSFKVPSKEPIQTSVPSVLQDILPSSILPVAGTNELHLCGTEVFHLSQKQHSKFHFSISASTPTPSAAA